MVLPDSDEDPDVDIFAIHSMATARVQLRAKRENEDAMDFVTWLGLSHDATMLKDGKYGLLIDTGAVRGITGKWFPDNAGPDFQKHCKKWLDDPIGQTSFLRWHWFWFL